MPSISEPIETPMPQQIILARRIQKAWWYEFVACATWPPVELATMHATAGSTRAADIVSSEISCTETLDNESQQS